MTRQLVYCLASRFSACLKLRYSECPEQRNATEAEVLQIPVNNTRVSQVLDLTFRVVSLQGFSGDFDGSPAASKTWQRQCLHRATGFAWLRRMAFLLLASQCSLGSRRHGTGSRARPLGYATLCCARVGLTPDTRQPGGVLRDRALK